MFCKCRKNKEYPQGLNVKQAENYRALINLENSFRSKIPSQLPLEPPESLNPCDAGKIAKPPRVMRRTAEEQARSVRLRFPATIEQEIFDNAKQKEIRHSRMYRDQSDDLVLQYLTDQELKKYVANPGKLVDGAIVLKLKPGDINRKEYAPNCSSNTKTQIKQ